MEWLFSLAPALISALQALSLGDLTGLSSTGLLIYFIVQALIKWYSQSKDTVVVEAFKDISLIYQILINILIGTKVSRVSIHKVSNGGSIPRVGVQLYDTMVYEQFQPPLTSIKGSWEKRPITQQLLEKITDLSLQKGITIIYNELASGSELSDAGATESLNQTKLYELYSEESAYYYLRLDFLEDPNLNATERDLIRVGIANIAKHFKNSTDRLKKFNIQSN